MDLNRSGEALLIATDSIWPRRERREAIDLGPFLMVGIPAIVCFYIADIDYYCAARRDILSLCRPATLAPQRMDELPGASSRRERGRIARAMYE